MQTLPTGTDRAALVAWLFAPEEPTMSTAIKTHPTYGAHWTGHHNPQARCELGYSTACGIWEHTPEPTVDIRQAARDRHARLTCTCPSCQGTGIERANAAGDVPQDYECGQCHYVTPDGVTHHRPELETPTPPHHDATMSQQVKAYDQGEWAAYTLYPNGTFARAWRSTQLTESLGMPTVEQSPLPLATRPQLGGPLHYAGRVFLAATGPNVFD